MDKVIFPYTSDDFLASLNISSERELETLQKLFSKNEFTHVVFINKSLPGLTKGLMKDVSVYKEKFKLSNDQFIFVYTDDFLLE
jgi:hypothetical protein